MSYYGVKIMISLALPFVLSVLSMIMVRTVAAQTPKPPTPTIGERASYSGETAFISKNPLDLGTVVEKSGNLYTITGGLRPSDGPNLFHSFDFFSLLENQTAKFENLGSWGSKLSEGTYYSSGQNMVFSPSKQTTTSNIFARVIGGELSQINGAIDTTDFGSANLWFMNPFGIIFGPKASLNVGGAAVFTTATYLELREKGDKLNGRFFGGTFSSSSADTVQFSKELSIVPVSRFGFLGESGTPTPTITVTQSKLESSAGSLSLVGGEIKIDGATLSAPKGEIRISSVGQHGYIGGEDGPVVSVDTTGQHSVVNTASAIGNIDVAHSIGANDTVMDTYISAKQVQTLPNPISIRDGSVQVAKLPSNNIRVTAPTILSLRPELLLDIDETRTVTGTLKDPYTTPVTVDFKSDSSDVAMPTKTSIVVPKEEQTFENGVKGLNEGETTVSATVSSKLKNPTARVPVTVRSPVGFFEFKGPEILDVGDQGAYRVTLTQAGRGGTAIELLNDRPDIVRLVSDKPIDMDGKTTSPDIVVEALKQGEATITARLRNSNKTIPVRIRVDERLNIQTFTAPELLDEGAQGSLLIKLNRADESPVVVELIKSGSRDSVTLEREVVTFNPKSDITQQVGIVGELAGDVTITARLRNTTEGPSATVKVESIPVESLTPDLAIKEDQTSTLNVTLARETQRQVRVGLTSSDPTVATVDPVVIIEPGTRVGSATVKGLKDGTVVVKATGLGGEDTATVQVSLLDPPALSEAFPNQLGIELTRNSVDNSVVVKLSEPFKRDVPIRLSSSDPNIATVGEVAVIKAGQTESNPIPVAGRRVGRAIISAVSGTSSAQAEVNVDIPTTSRQAIDLASSAQYPRIVTTPPATIAVPRLLAGRCAGNKDGQFSSFAQLNRDTAPPQPGRYLSSPTLMENGMVVGEKAVIPEISFMLGTPKLLTVKPEALAFTMLTENCGR